MKKKTDDLINEIVDCANISNYITANEEEFLHTSLYEHLRQLLADTGLKVSQVVDRSFKGEYIYQVFRGIKKPGRDVLLCIALAMELGLEQTAFLLRIAHMPQLDARNRRDSILMFALNQKLSVPDANDMLYDFEEPCL